MIGYAVRISAGPLKIRCAEILQWRAGEPTPRHQFGFGGTLPRESGDGVVWQCHRLGAEYRWQRRQAPLPAMVLHEEPAGRIEWICFCPAAQVAGRVRGGAWAGSGYVERLTVTLPIARLPFRELRWGRFIAETQSCQWIDWRGTVTRRWCFHNGVSVAAAAPGRQGLAWNGHQLRLEPGVTVRSGRVFDTSLRGAGPMRWLLPRAVRRTEETKWCSAGVLTDAQGREHPGWSIHEVAHFR